jgi:hypothetical protein
MGAPSTNDAAAFPVLGAAHEFGDCIQPSTHVLQGGIVAEWGQFLFDLFQLLATLDGLHQAAS